MNAPEKPGSMRDSPKSKPPARLTPRLRLALVRRCTGPTVLAAMLAGSVFASETPVEPGERLNTLVYSPAERLAITRARQVQGLAQAESVPISNEMTLNGVVKRKGGNSTAWVNGQAIKDGQPAPPVHRVTTTERGVILDGTPVRVGEALDLSTLERTDIVAPGAVTIRRSK